MALVARLSGAVLVMALTACSGIKTRTNFDPSAVQTVEGYRTYAWMPMKEGADERIYNSITQARVHQAVDREMSERGYRLVEGNQKPDFKLGWHGAIDKKVDVDVVNRFYGYAWDPWFDPFFGPVAYGGAGGPQTVVREYREGTLILDVVDAKSNNLVWRGSAETTLADNMGAKRSQRLIDKSVDKMLKDFPPEPEKE